jgi:hypothetical protein
MDTKCEACTNSCSGPGLTGRYWPFRSKTDKCVCETYPGFFLEAGAFMAEQCDADRDGWVRKEADDSAIRDDEALLQNARCKLLRAERVILRDEYGGTLTLNSCRTEGFVVAGGACNEAFPLRLLEGPRNDMPGPVSSTKTPVYGRGDAGRRLTGVELNGLTKACVSDLGDFDEDGAEDLNQVQPYQFEPGSDDRARLAGFAYFIELLRAYYAPPTASQMLGSLVIEERSRCDASRFPFHYGANDAYGMAQGAAADPGYWRTCTRYRDATFNRSTSEPGYDFGQYACTDPTGSCGCTDPTGSCDGKLPGAASATVDYGNINPNQTLLRDVGLCALDGKTPADGKFRGLNHSSQFRCLRATDNPSRSNESAPSSFAPGAQWAFNNCSAHSCDGASGDCAENKPFGSAGAAEPLLDCQVGMPESNQVGFAARPYQAYGTGELYTQKSAPAAYQGGCINEDQEWGDKLCPVPEFARGYETDSFGRYSCYGDKSRWIWLGPAAMGVRSTMYWSSGDPGSPANGSGWSYE